MREPFRELSLRQNATHHVGFAEAGRKKVFARRLVCERTIVVRQKKFPRRIGGEPSKPFIIFTARIVDNQSEREGGLIVLADPHWMGEFWQPRSQSLDRGILERLQIRQHFPGLRIVPFAQLRAEL